MTNFVKKYFSPFVCMKSIADFSKAANSCELEMHRSTKSLDAGIEYLNKYNASCDSHARLRCIAQNDPEAVRGVLTSCPNFVVNWSLAKYPGMRTPGAFSVLREALKTQSQSSINSSPGENYRIAQNTYEPPGYEPPGYEPPGYEPPVYEPPPGFGN